MPRGLLILDNTVLTNFALADRPDLILALRQIDCATTPAVMAEYERGVRARGLAADAWQQLQLLPLQPEEAAFAAGLSPQLDAGERTCIAIAVQRRALLATDDAVARRTARRHGVSLTGTLGLLALIIRQNHLSLAEGNRLLAEMIALGYRSPLSRLDELL